MTIGWATLIKYERQITQFINIHLFNYLHQMSYIISSFQFPFANSTPSFADEPPDTKGAPQQVPTQIGWDLFYENVLFYL